MRTPASVRSPRVDAPGSVAAPALCEMALPEVSLVCVLSADKQGLLRSATSLVQTLGRAARHGY